MSGNHASPDRASWIDPDAILLAETEDILSKVRFRIWRVTVSPSGVRRRQSLLRMRQDKERMRYLVEHVPTGGLHESFDSWEAVLAWHSATVISAGPLLLEPPVPSG